RRGGRRAVGARRRRGLPDAHRVARLDPAAIRKLAGRCHRTAATRPGRDARGTDMSTTKRRLARAFPAEVIADAPVEAGARVVADVTRTGEWSHECLQVSWLGGGTAAAPGARFRGRNRAGWWRWSRTCEVLAVDPPRQIAWRTIPTPLFV